MSSNIGNDDKRLRGDLRLIRRAINEGWAIPPEVLQQLPTHVTKWALDETMPPAVRIRAVETLLKMHGQNVASADILEQSVTAEASDAPTVQNLMGELLQDDDYLEFCRRRKIDRDPGDVRDDSEPGKVATRKASG